MTLFVLKMFMGVRNFLKLVCCCILWANVVQVSAAHDVFIDVIAASKPAVVSIEVARTKKSMKSNAAIEALGDNADFFSDELKGKNQPRKGRGSGFIIDYGQEQGSSVFILTAAHVVRGAFKVHVVFSDSKRKKAEVVWLNRKNDVALLEVDIKEGSNHALELDDQVAVEGQGALAIAGSFDLSISSSVGIVSAVDVVLPGKKKLKLIQTDAAINPGSSGGPLLNNQGKVIGLISNIYTKTGSFSGAAFAIPAPAIKKLIAIKTKR